MVGHVISMLPVDSRSRDQWVAMGMVGHMITMLPVDSTSRDQWVAMGIVGHVISMLLGTCGSCDRYPSPFLQAPTYIHVGIP